MDVYTCINESRSPIPEAPSTVSRKHEEIQRRKKTKSSDQFFQFIDCIVINFFFPRPRPLTVKTRKCNKKNEQN